MERTVRSATGRQWNLSVSVSAASRRGENLPWEPLTLSDKEENGEANCLDGSTQMT